MEKRPYMSWEMVENFMVDVFKKVGVINKVLDCVVCFLQIILMDICIFNVFQNIFRNM